MNKNKRVSIVIPVYNEEEHLAACLDAIASQIVAPYEVIVVDNNSTDNTMAVAAQYPFVTLLQEKHQGVAYARDTGFNACRGDIAGRIDADTLLPPEWVKRVQTIFTDGSVDAVSGAITYRDIAFPHFFGRVELFFRQWVANGLKGKGFLYGGNMAMRRSCWKDIRSATCSKKGLHEDIDIGIHAGAAGKRVLFDRSLHASILLRRFDTNFIDFWQWAWLTPATFSKHGMRYEPRIATVAFLATVFYLPLKLLHKMYDPDTGRISIQKLFAAKPQTQRVNPATFVD